MLASSRRPSAKRELDVRQLLRLIRRDEDLVRPSVVARQTRLDLVLAGVDLELGRRYARRDAVDEHRRPRRARCAARRRAQSGVKVAAKLWRSPPPLTSSSRTSARCRAALNSSRCTPGVNSASTSGVAPSRVPSSSTFSADLGLGRDRDEPGQLRQRQRDRLIGGRPDLDLGVERVIARQLGRHAMRARAQQQPVADLQLEQRARQADGGRRGLDVERHRLGRECEPRRRRQDRKRGRHPDRALADAASARLRAAGSAGLNAIGVMAISAVRPPRASSSRSGGAVSPAVTIHSMRIASAPPAIRHSSRARSNAITSPSRNARVPVSSTPPTRTLRAFRPGCTKKTSSRRPT